MIILNQNWAGGGGSLRAIFTVILLFAVSLPLTAPAAAQDVASVPYRTTERGLIIVDVHVNDTGPFPFLIDTGATASVIFGTLARRLNLPDTKQGYAIVHGIAETGEHPMAIVNSLRIGGAQVPNLDVILLKSATVQRTWMGIVGLDFLSHYVLVFRHKTKTLALFQRQAVPQRLLSGWREVPVYHDKTLKRPYPLLFVPVKIDGRKIDGLIDLGSTTPILNWAGARRIGFNRTYDRLREQWLIQGATGEFAPRTVIKNTDIAIGRLRSEGSLLVADSPAMKELKRQETPFIILNAALFSQADFAVDVKTPSFHIKPRRVLPRSYFYW